uniref:CRIB domain-containing protein n=1 Tax=Ananas comosus var. bracteatus TaxID=296719 RepID=A0A6V7PJD5_ANACO|nr:unnamed protein product [Ananas comosus var. bracteatus]
MKGLLRGLRYISQIFDNKEQEMQIGYPTDVKHVAHIGWDGPSAAAAPSWMNEFQSAPATNGEGGTDSPSGEQQQPPDAPPGRHSRRNASSEGPPRRTRQARRLDPRGPAVAAPPVGRQRLRRRLPLRDSSLPEGSRRGRRHRTTAAAAAAAAAARLSLRRRWTRLRPFRSSHGAGSRRDRPLPPSAAAAQPIGTVEGGPRLAFRSGDRQLQRRPAGAIIAHQRRRWLLTS